MCNLGLDAKLYYDVDTALASVSWVELTVARDVTTDASADEAEVSDRRSNFKTTCPSLLTLETSVTCTYENGDANVTAMRDAFLNRTPILIAVMDGDIAVTGTQGFVYWANVYSHSFSQPLTDGTTVEMTFKPAVPPAIDPTTTPQWYTAS